MDDVRVHSWHELHEALFEGAWNADIARYRSNFVYRGLSTADYPLLTSLQRLGGGYAKLEPHLLRNFRKYAHRNAHDLALVGESNWGWLALAQHHGLPTRLLDWTHSPMVAAHFATANLDRHDRDGVIWCIDYVRANALLPKPLQAVLAEQQTNGSFTLDMLQRASGSLREFSDLAAEPFLAFLEPPSLDDRIVNQYALFSVMNQAVARLDEWVKRQPGLAKRIIIPTDLKGEVRDKLDQSNISERVLFPGLDGLSKWLRRHYSPSGHGAAEVVDGSI